jgi:hypothetical protein
MANLIMLSLGSALAQVRQVSHSHKHLLYYEDTTP